MIESMLEILWRSLAIIALCSLLVACLPDRFAAWRRQLALAGLMALPAMALLLPFAARLGWQLNLAWPAQAVVDPAAAIASGSAARAWPDWAPPVSSEYAASPAVGGGAAWLETLQALAPTLVFSLMLAGALLGLWRWARRLNGLRQFALQAEYTAAVQPRLGYHRGLDSPLCFGWREPTILLPEQARDWPAAQRRRALAHEQAHLRHGDWPAQQLVEVLLCLCWWHPLYWYLRRSFLRDIEILADAAAVRRTRDRKAYARDLLALAQGTRPLPTASLAMRPQPPLVQRLNTLINQTEVNAMKPLQIVAVQFATMLIVALLSLTQVQAHEDAPHPPKAPDHREIEKEIRLGLEEARTELQRLVENGVIEQELLDELEMLGDIEVTIDGDTRVFRGESIDGDEIRRIVIEAVGEVDAALAGMDEGEVRKHRIVTIDRDSARHIHREHETGEAGIEARMRALEARERALERERAALEQQREAIEQEREALQRAQIRAERNG